MGRLAASVVKELRVLFRDRGGMVVLFLMPAALVLVISLIQENVLLATGESGIRILFLDRDRGKVGKLLKDRLEGLGSLEVTGWEGGPGKGERDAEEEVRRGRFQVLVSVPPGASLSLPSAQATAPAGTAPLSIGVFFDPTLRGPIRTSILYALRLSLREWETAEKIALLGGGDWAGREWVKVEELTGDGQGPVRFPTSAQQNVPAWTLFGLFFIVVPLSGVLIRERRDGTLFRLLIIPGAAPFVFLGKTAAYLAVCLVQVALMLGVGILVLPLFGAPRLEMGGDLPAVAVLAVASSLAAIGYGLLVGTLARSYEQASMFGSVSIVIAAAFGGVMIPVYLMPKALQAISHFSPLSWGLEGFLDLFVRGKGLPQVLPRAGLLVGFGAACAAAALLGFGRRDREP